MAEKMWMKYDQWIEQLMGELAHYYLKGLSGGQEKTWQDVFENVNLCRRWLNQIELGVEHPIWLQQIEEGLQAAEADLKALLA